MATRTTTKWLSASLYYGEPWEEFLSKAVKPYVEVVMQTGVADSFFFERSWEKGPNIRLWFKGNPYILAKMLRPNLDEHFQHYFESRPSSVIPPKYDTDYPSSFHWHPNNSIQYTTYSPALDMPGGAAEFSIMEKQYEASSLLILATLKEKADRWTYNEMISSAIKIHLGLAYAVGMDLQEANHFFKYLLKNWFAKQATEQQQTATSFAKIFTLQRKDIIPYHRAIWELLKRYESMEEPQFIDWIKTNAHINMKLSLALDQQHLRPRQDTFANVGNHPESWAFFESLIKLTNNRLGIFNKNEGYLFYALSESLQLAAADSFYVHRERI